MKLITNKGSLCWILVMSCAWVAGCSSPAKVDQAVPEMVTFREVYKQLQANQKPVEAVEQQEPTISLSAQSMPLVAFARHVADQTGVSVVVESSLDQKPVSVDVQSQRVSDVLGVVARRLGVQVTRTGDLFYLGSLRPEDRGVLVRRVVRLETEQLQRAIKALLSEQGRVVSMEGGLVVVSDRVEVLGRVSLMLQDVERAPAESWVVQLHIVSVSDSINQTTGLDVTPTADIALSFARASSGDTTSIASLSTALSAVLRASYQTDLVRLEASPMFVMVDGSQAKQSDGKQVPVPKRTTSSEGTVTTEDYQIVETGLIVTLALRDIGQSRARINLAIELSEIVGYVEDAPVVDGLEFETRSIVTAGGVYLLGSMQQTKLHRGKESILKTVKSQDDSTRQWQIWARCYKIGQMQKAPD